jgi:hypothetical protein
MLKEEVVAYFKAKLGALQEKARNPTKNPSQESSSRHEAQNLSASYLPIWRL